MTSPLFSYFSTPSFHASPLLYKVNSVQEAGTKCIAVHLLEFEILPATWKRKNVKMLFLLMKIWRIRVWCSLFHLFQVICKISNFNMWTAKHMAQASCTDLTLPNPASSLVSQYLTPPNLKDGDGIYGWPLRYFAMNDIVFFGNKETGIV